MGAPKGNKFWEARSSHGRKPIFDTPEKLWDAACQYFAWVEDNPLWEAKVTQFQGAPVDMIVPKMRAMTITACCRYMGIGVETLDDYSRRDDFSGIVKEIKEIIYDQKFTGAAADLLNSNIIARELGLADKKAVGGADDLPAIAITSVTKTIVDPLGDES